MARETASHGPVERGDRQRRRELRAETAPLPREQDPPQPAGGDPGLAGEPRAVRDPKMRGLDALPFEPGGDRAPPLVPGSGGAETLRPEGEQQVAGHHVVAELVDSPDGEGERRRAVPMPEDRPFGNRGHREPAFDPPAHPRPEGARHPAREPGRRQHGALEPHGRTAAREASRHGDPRQGGVERGPGREGAGDLEEEVAIRAAARPELGLDPRPEPRHRGVGPRPHRAAPGFDDHLERVEVDEEGVGGRVVRPVRPAVELPRRRLPGDREPGVVDDEPARNRLEAARPHRREEPPELLDHQLGVPAPDQHEVAVEAPLPDRPGHVDASLPLMVRPQLLQGREGGDDLDRGRRVAGDVRAVADERRRVRGRRVLHPDAERFRGQAVARERLLHRRRQPSALRASGRRREQGRRGGRGHPGEEPHPALPGERVIPTRPPPARRGGGPRSRTPPRRPARSPRGPRPGAPRPRTPAPPTRSRCPGR